jgi:hypothetical protein
MDGLSPNERTFSVLRAAEGPGPHLSSLLCSASFLLEIRCTGVVGAGNKEDFMESLDVSKPHIHSYFINSPSVYPWFLVARYHQSSVVRDLD